MKREAARTAACKGLSRPAWLPPCMLPAPAPRHPSLAPAAPVKHSSVAAPTSQSCAVEARACYSCRRRSKGACGAGGHQPESAQGSSKFTGGGEEGGRGEQANTERGGCNGMQQARRRPVARLHGAFKACCLAAVGCPAGCSRAAVRPHVGFVGLQRVGRAGEGGREGVNGHERCRRQPAAAGSNRPHPAAVSPRSQRPLHERSP